MWNKPNWDPSFDDDLYPQVFTSVLTADMVAVDDTTGGRDEVVAAVVGVIESTVDPVVAGEGEDAPLLSLTWPFTCEKDSS